MDGSRFDAVARSVAGASRRSVLKATLGLALGGAAVTVAVEGASAATKRKSGQICRKDGDCLSGACAPKDASGRQYCQCGGPLVLAGSPNGAAVCVDDEIFVYVNGNSVYAYDDIATCVGQVPLGTVNPGDKIRVVARDSPDYCEHKQLSPLYLYCASDGGAQTLDGRGVPLTYIEDGPPCAGITFYDKTFTAKI